MTQGINVTIAVPDWTIYSGAFDEPIERGSILESSLDFALEGPPIAVEGGEVGFVESLGISTYTVRATVVQQSTVVVLDLGYLRLAAWNGNGKLSALQESRLYELKLYISFSDYADAPTYRDAERRFSTSGSWRVDDLSVMSRAYGNSPVAIADTSAVDLGTDKDFVLSLTKLS